jgi:hypothetical protein
VESPRLRVLIQDYVEDVPVAPGGSADCDLTGFFAWASSAVDFAVDASESPPSVDRMILGRELATARFKLWTRSIPDGSISPRSRLRVHLNPWHAWATGSDGGSTANGCVPDRLLLIERDGEPQVIRLDPARTQLLSRLEHGPRTVRALTGSVTGCRREEVLAMLCDLSAVGVIAFEPETRA